MPVAVACSCGAKLRVPDTAAGKRVKCPKCGDAVAVPAAEFEMVDDDPPPVKRKPRVLEDEDDEPRPAKRTAVKSNPVEVNEAVDDDEDDGEEDERTRKKTGKGKGKSNKVKGKNREQEKKKRMWTLILGICGATFVLGAVGVVVAIVMNSQDPAKAGISTQPSAPPKPALPAGWSTFQGDGFSVGVPDAVQFQQKEVPAGMGGPQGRLTAQGKNYTNGVQPQPGQPVWAYLVTVGSITEKDLFEFNQDPEKGWADFKKQVAASGTRIGGGTAFSVTGGSGREFTVSIDLVKLSGVMRVVVRKNRVYAWAVLGQNNPALDDPNVKPFFDSFEFDARP